jgi:hypothetical protein
MKDMPTGKEFWEQAKEAVRRDNTEYFVNRLPIVGEMHCYGPFSDAREARDYFEHTYPAFDGGDVTLTKVLSQIPGVSTAELRDRAWSEEYGSGNPEEAKWGALLDKSTTLMARDVWEASWDHGEVDWHHKGKQYDPGFLAEIEREEKRIEYSQKYQSGERFQLPSHQAEKFRGLHERLEAVNYAHLPRIIHAREQQEMAVNGGCTDAERSEPFEVENTNTRDGETTMDNVFLRAGYDAQSLRVQQLESWVIEAISKPAMPRELRIEGLGLVQDISPTARQAVAGQMQALQAAAQLAALEQQQLLQIRGLLVAEQQALGARQATLSNSEAMGAANTQNLLNANPSVSQPHTGCSPIQ